MGRVTLQTIADELGVSRMTVSNAFSRPDQLSEAMRSKVLAAADRLGYAGPDPTGRALARGRSGTIGALMTSSPSDAFSDEVTTGFLAGATQALAPTGLSLTLLHPSGRGDVVPARDLPLDGALVYSCESHVEAVSWLERRGLPLVFVDFAPRDGARSVTMDDAGGARQAAQHVIDLGHRNVGIIIWGHSEGADPEQDPAYYVERERIKGWSEALDAAGAKTVWESDRGEGHQLGVELGRRILARPDRPTAVLCYSDNTASGVLRAAAELGLRVPEDVSVVGFDDVPLARRMWPPLTTIRQDLAAKGRIAVEQLLDAMARQSAGKPPVAQHLVLPTELVVRDSTARPPA